jgi:hypothetical protein
LEHDAFLPIRGEITIKDNAEEKAGNGLSGLEVVACVPCVLRSVVCELDCWGQVLGYGDEETFGIVGLNRIVGESEKSGKLEVCEVDLYVD